jgi:hypothetical protein
VVPRGGRGHRREGHDTHIPTDASGAQASTPGPVAEHRPDSGWPLRRMGELGVDDYSLPPLPTMCAMAGPGTLLFATRQLAGRSRPGSRAVT